ncbi:hypothetical protein AURDEDRAFT_113621 [Auricularia subglabra TFB-10046 SS5]|nr:hypothetical protein AURDEDRAFT_113621 [Auricularia subglabra TFB-10046 SS5]
MFPDLPLDEVFNISERVWIRRHVTPRMLLGYSVSKKTTTYLCKMLDQFHDCSLHSAELDLAAAFLRPAISSIATGTIFFAEYRACSSHADWICLTQVDDTDEEIRYADQYAEIPACHAVEVRNQLRLSIPDPWPEDLDFIHYLVSRTPHHEGSSNFVEYLRR